MRPGGLSIALTLLASMGLCFAADPSDRVLLVVNDASPSSVAIGEAYAELRSLPPECICHIRTATSAAVDRDIYLSEIRDPLGEWLSAHDLQDRILYIVTTDGVPLWVRGDGGPVGDLASVDSELTLLYRHLLGRDDPVLGRVINPYFAPFVEANRFSSFRRDQQDIYLVTRLFAAGGARPGLRATTVGSQPSNGLFAIDLPSRERTFLQDWADQTKSRLEARKQSVVSSEVGVPLQASAPLLGYFGLLQAGEKLTWSPGAVAVLYGDSWTGLDCRAENGSRETGNGSREDGRTGGPEDGASEPRNPELETRHSEPATENCPDNKALGLLTEGVPAVVFNVADPTMDGYARPQILFPAYVAGHDLAESVYLATRYLSWRQVIAGDPLAAIATPQSSAPEWSDVRDSATGGPKLFAERRRKELQDRYSTSDEVITLLMKAEFAEAHDQPEQALTLVEQSLGRDPSVWDANWLRARLLERLGRYEDAYAAYQKALELASQAKVRHDLLGRPDHPRVEARPPRHDRPPAPGSGGATRRVAAGSPGHPG